MMTGGGTSDDVIANEIQLRFAYTPPQTKPQLIM